MIYLTFDYNFSRCRPIFKILSLADFHPHAEKIYHFALSVFLHCLVKTWKLQLLPISVVYCTWDLRVYLARYEAALIVQIWIPWQQDRENNAAVFKIITVMSLNWSSGWLMCNMGCSRQSLMKYHKRLWACFCTRWAFTALASTLALLLGRWTAVGISYKRYCHWQYWQ